MKKFESEYVTVYMGNSEVLVFGEESDWIVRYANTTNAKDTWRKWFGNRESAEQFAEEVAKCYFPEFLGKFDAKPRTSYLEKENK